MIGRASKSSLCTNGGSIPCGRLMRTRSTAERTSSKAFCGSEPTSKSTCVCELPRVTVEVICLTPEMPETASSTTRVIWLSISEGAAPD
jgi:hypothetical protein